MNKRYLVTGGCGFIGSALVRALVKQGDKVRILDDCSRGIKSRLNDVEVFFCPGSIDRIEHRNAIRLAVRGVDAVIHLAYVNGTATFYTDPALVLGVAVKGIVNLLDACAEEKVKEFHLASSSEVYQTPPVIPTPENVPLVVPDPYNPRFSYGGGKIISELMVLHYGNFERLTIFRPHNIYGPDMGDGHVIPQFVSRYARECRNSTEKVVKLQIQGTGKETRCYCHIEDAVQGILAVVERGEHRGIYNIGSDEEISAADLAHAVGHCFQRLVDIVPSELAGGSTPRRCPDLTKLRGLGWSPKIKLFDGLKQYVEWYKGEKCRVS